MTKENIIGIDLAGKPKNPTGVALWRQKIIKAHLAYADDDLLTCVKNFKPLIVAIDAPLKLPKIGILRKADREMIERGYRVFPPILPAMKALTLRAIRLNERIRKEGFKTLEVHPTSTRKALGMPSKDWGKIQTILKGIGLKGEIQMRVLTPHEIDAVTAALTAYLHIKGQTEEIGDEEEGFIIVPKRRDWRKLKL
ncbi:MAG: DUF429 domain-containing protein [Candidatus Bathyarchaeia archaeon]